MRRKFFDLALGAMLLAVCFPAQAQQPTRIPHIGILTTFSPSVVSARIEGFRQGLRELGYVEGKNIVIEWRSAGGNNDRLPVLAAELVGLKVDVIVSPGPTATRAFKEATSTIPIVMAQKEIVPKLSRMAVIGNSTIPGDAQALRETVLAAGAYEIYLRYLDVMDTKDLEATFRVAAKGRADGLLVLGNPYLNAQRKQVVDLAVKHRLPATYTRPEYIDAGGLMYYGTNYPDLFRRAAYYVDKILKGAKPADLPIEQPKKFELIVNLKAAKQIGLTISPNVLARADRVLK